MISIVIPNYNSASLLEKNLPKLLAILEKTKLDFEIIISDDASSDNSTAVANKILKSSNLPATSYQILATEKNTGFSGNVDRGIRAARGEIVFTIKTDVLPSSPDYFPLMLSHFQKSHINSPNLKTENHQTDKPESENRNPKTDNREVFAVSGALLTVENNTKEVRGQGILVFHRGFFQHFRTHADFEKWSKTAHKENEPNEDSWKSVTNSRKSQCVSAWSDGGASAFRRDLYLKLGGFDPLYNPFYWEDTDLGYRAWKAGYEVDFEPKAEIAHHFESGAIRRHYDDKKIQLISQRNQFIFVWKNADTWHIILHKLYLPLHFFNAAKSGNWLFFEAFFQALMLLPQILSARFAQKPLSQLSDSAALHLTSLN